MIYQVKMCKNQLGTRFRDKDFLIKTCCFLLNFTASEGHFRELPGGKRAKTQFGTRTPNFRDKDPEVRDKVILGNFLGEKGQKPSSGQGPRIFGTRTPKFRDKDPQNSGQGLSEGRKCDRHLLRLERRYQYPAEYWICHNAVSRE